MTKPRDLFQDDDIGPELHAYIDGKLDPQTMADVQARLASDTDALLTVAGMSSDRRMIREAAAAMDAGPIDMRTASLERTLAKRLVKRQIWVRATGPAVRQIAAGVVLFTMGWGGHMALGPAADAYPGYVQEGLGAHQVFGHDDLAQVDFTFEGTAADLDRISQKLKQKIDSPALDGLGLELVGTRLSGTREGPLAQFIYENVDGHRLSLVVMPHPQGVPAAELTLANTDSNRIGYWSDQSLDYALIADSGDLQIENIASEIASAFGPAR